MDKKKLIILLLGVLGIIIFAILYYNFNSYRLAPLDNNDGVIIIADYKIL